MDTPFVQIIYIFWLTFFVATHISLTFVVYKDAKAVRFPALGITPFLWGGVAFSLPVIGMFVYWLMNHSILCRSFNWPGSVDHYNEEKRGNPN